jgi:hypothetical protein
MSKNVIALIIIALFISVSCSFAKTFSDVDANHWANQYIDSLSNSGVINGYEDGTYRPQNSVTRAEFMKLMVCSDPKMERNAKFNTPDENRANWYDPYTNYIRYLKLSSYNYLPEEFNQPITRVEIATFIKNFADLYKLIDNKITDTAVVDQTQKQLISAVIEKGYSKNKNLTYKEAWDIVTGLPEDEANEIKSIALSGIKYTPKEEKSKFNDIDDLLYIQSTAVKEAEKLGIINGYEDGSFKPKNNVTRAEVSAIIFRWMNLLKDNNKIKE